MSGEYKNEESNIINHTLQITHYVSPITHYNRNIKYALKFKMEIGTARSKTFCP